MSEGKIKSVILHFPMSEEMTWVRFEIGENGVTEIKEAQKNGEYALIKYYEIYKGENLCAEMHHFSVVEYVSPQ
jgi:hypothetical protein